MLRFTGERLGDSPGRYANIQTLFLAWEADSTLANGTATKSPPVSQVFFGIGAMKSGTSWLHTLLSQCPDCGLPPVKEVHFFDLRHTLPSGKPEDSSETFWHRRIAALGRDDIVRAQLMEVSALRTLDEYAAYLSRFRKRAYGEITPSYALLPPQGFEEMVTLFPDAKFIFVMRDPVDRLWSQARFEAGGRSQPFRKGSAPGGEEVERRARIMLSRKGQVKSEYEMTIGNIESIVDRERILYLFYETLFTDDAVAEIEQFLGIRLQVLASAMFSQRVNVSRPAEITPALRARVREVLAPTYAFIEQRFGRPLGWMY